MAGFTVQHVEEEHVDSECGSAIRYHSHLHDRSQRHLPLPASISSQRIPRNASTDTEGTIGSHTDIDDDAALSPIAVSYPSAHRQHSSRSKADSKSTTSQHRSKRDQTTRPPSYQHRENTPVSARPNLTVDLSPISIGAPLRRTFALDKHQFRKASKDFAVSSLKNRASSAKADLGRPPPVPDAPKSKSSSSDSNLHRKARTSTTKSTPPSRPTRKDHGREHR